MSNWVEVVDRLQKEYDLTQLCVRIYAHNEAGTNRITLGGRSTIPEQALGVANEILGILKVDFSDIEEEVEKMAWEIHHEDERTDRGE